MNVHQILMVGGDRRQLYLASALRQDGLQAGEALLSRGAPDLEEITALAAAADAVVLGIPALDAAGMIAAPLCPASISPGPLLEAMRPPLEEVLRQEDCFSLRDLAVNGRDLIAAGVPQGPQVGEILSRLLEEVMDERLPNEREALLQRVRQLR